MVNARQLQATVKRQARKGAGAFTGAPLATSARQLRQLFNLSLRPVAQAIGVSVSTLSNLERGAEVGLSTALRLAAFFEKRVEEIWQLPNKSGAPTRRPPEDLAERRAEEHR